MAEKGGSPGPVSGLHSNASALDEDGVPMKNMAGRNKPLPLTAL
jgi:hypothetical protein